MHVCVDLRLLNSSGIGTFLKSCLLSLAHSKQIHFTFLCNPSQKNQFSFPCEVVYIKSKVYSLKEQWELIKNIPRCDLFWSPHFNIPLFPIKAKKRMTTICDVYHLAHFNTLPFEQKIYAKLLYNAAFFLSDCVITISEFSKKEIRRFAFFKPKKLEVINPSFDFEPSFSTSLEKDCLLFVGNLKPHKNLHRLVQAYAQVKPSLPLYIVGKKEELITWDKKLFKEVESSSFLKKQVLFTGYISEKALKELYARALLFIFPSIYEGFGYPPLEAMASGCAVIASKEASIPEVCQDAVEYVNPYSVDSMAYAISKLLSDSKRRAELIQKGRELIEKKRLEKNRIMDVIHACCCNS